MTFAPAGDAHSRRPPMLVLALALAPALALLHSFAHAGPPATPVRTSSRLPVAASRLPLHFEPNLGQAPPSVQFLARSGGLTAYFEPTAVDVVIASNHHDSRTAEPMHYRMELEGSRNPRFAAQSEQPGVSAYFRGRDPSAWIPRVPQFASLMAQGVYHGIDVRYYDTGGGQLEFDFLLAPRADPSRIRMRFRDVRSIALTAAGDLRIETATGIVTQREPQAYQTVRGRRHPVTARYVVAGKTVSIRAGPYDRALPLVIDPVLVYSTLLGSGEGAGIAVDAAGAAYITGWTAGQFVTANPLANGGGAVRPTDAFVTKLVFGTGNILQAVYSTYLGGSGSDRGAAIAVNSSGSVYVTGRTSSADFPIANPLTGGTQLTSPMNAFIAKLSFNANTRALSLDYSTLLGAGAVAFGRGIAVDSTGAAYVTGATIAMPQATPFPTQNSLPGTGSANQGSGDAFVVKAVQPQAGAALELVYSTMLGGAGDDEGLAIAAGPSGSAYVVGRSSAPAQGTAFPTANPLAGQSPAGTDAFVTKLVFSQGSLSLGFSTLLGGESTDEARAVAVDSQESVFIAGYSLSPLAGRVFPVLNPLPGGDANRGGEDAFLAKLVQSPGGVTMQYSTLIGGSGNDQARGLALDSSGNAYVVGETASSDFPSASALAESVAPALGVSDAFVTKVAHNSATGAPTLVFSTFLGGDGPEVGRAIGVDVLGSVYVTGESARGLARTFPFTRALTPNGTTYLDGTFNVFATRISDAPPPAGKRLTVSVIGDGAVSSVVPLGQIECPQVCTAVLDVPVALAATPAKGNLFSGWSGDCTGAGRCDISMTSDRQVTATFATGVTLFVGRAGSGGGIVRGTGIDCGGTCQSVYPPGTQVTLVAMADPGSTFTGWSGVCASFGTGTCTFTITQTISATANFTLTGGARQGLHFVPLDTPCRLADTRSDDGAFGKPALSALETRTFALPGRCGIPLNANAYALNVTVVPKGPLSYLTIFPAGQALPVVSTLNSLDGRIKANAATVPAGVNGAVSVYVTHATDLILDINGYFVPPGANALPFHVSNPCRLVDTRNAGGAWGGPIMADLETRTIPVYTSACAIPTAASAYSLNVTVVPTTTLSFLTVWPAGPAPLPTVSTLNSITGAVTANAAIVPAGAPGTNGGIRFYSTHRTTLVVDINGYFGAAGAAPAPLSFYPLPPCRLLDSRAPDGHTGGPILAGQQTRDLQPAIANCGVPSNARAYSLNATVVPTSALGYLTLWPSGQQIPTVSTLNSTDGAIASNAAIVPAGVNGAIKAFASNTTHLILDINGYFAP